MTKLSSEPYKGTRDFYPADMRLQNYIFNTMRQVSERYGYQEYTASIIEETDLYRAKSGEEIVGEQTYSFTDRGDRDITLRPEMTPTVARMVANKRRELVFPVRWYSIPNCFRYERPQRGRLREFWQLNVDILGVTSIFADAEVIEVAYQIMIAFGAKPENFLIRINNRKLMNELYTRLELSPEQSHKLSKLIDRKNKMSAEEFEAETRKLVTTSYDVFEKFIRIDSIEALSSMFQDSPAAKEIIEVIGILKTNGVTNTVFDPTLMRGFDYYTGIVFEVFDTNPANSRAMFGGGRYDNLVDLFGVESVPAFGFGMGDVTMQDYLETYNLLPNLSNSRMLTIIPLDPSTALPATQLADRIRAAGYAVSVDYTDKNVGTRIKNAEKDGSQYVLCVGSEEVQYKKYTLKNLLDGTEEKDLDVTTITAMLQK